jgi:sulfate transport system ATP-binding protein
MSRSIIAESINKRYGDFQALTDVSIEVPDGSLTALLGPSGSGKSTLLRVLAGLELQDTGRVLIGGDDVSQLPVQERGIGFVFQHYAPFRHMTVRNNVAFALKIRGLGKTQVAERVEELLHLVQLDGYAGRYPNQLSGGQRQRMALARALAAQPSVLLLDEPFGALDVHIRAELRDHLRNLHDQQGTTTVIVTHDREEALELANRVVVLNHGKVEQIGTPDELYDEPATPFVMGFIGPVIEFEGALVRPHDILLVRDAEQGSHEAIVQRVTRLGFEVRVELVLRDGSPVTVLLARPQALELELTEGAIVQVIIDSHQLTRFADPEPEPAVAAAAAPAADEVARTPAVSARLARGSQNGRRRTLQGARD